MRIMIFDDHYRRNRQQYQDGRQCSPAPPHGCSAAVPRCRHRLKRSSRVRANRPVVPLTIFRCRTIELSIFMAMTFLGGVVNLARL